MIQEYRIDNDDRFKVDYVPEFITLQESVNLFNLLENKFKKYQKRQSLIFANPDVKYTIHYRNQIMTKTSLPWIPELLIIKNKLEAFLKENYKEITLTTCVIQRYPTGKTGIKPHRDKELNHATPICGISLGQTRILDMGNYKSTVLSLPLENQSLYLILPGTNDYFTHSIKEDDSKNIRLSLTFRNY
jgi:alkylated DNA repair dioxygenase AlkB